MRTLRSRTPAIRPTATGRRAARRALARALAGLLLGFAISVGAGSGIDAAFAQTQSQPAREAAAPAASLLPTEAERERFHALAEELRCLVCQNQTLADSNAELAADLRREVEELMLAGRNDDEIKAHLVQRYGDFVLYRPPLQRNTWLLWLGPFGLLVFGGLVWWRVQRSHRGERSPAGEDRRDTRSDDGLERARRLLD